MIRRVGFRGILALVGCIACLYGFAVVVDSDAAVSVSLSTPMVAGVGIVAVIAGAVGLHRRESRPLPDGSRGMSASLPVPGEQWLARLADHSPRGVANATGGTQPLREELQATLIERLVADGVPPETAREWLERGNWTDDHLAAAFLRGEPPTRRERFRALFRSESAVQRRARRAMAAIADQDGSSSAGSATRGESS